MSYTYTFVRLLVVLAKPISIIALLNFTNIDNANKLAFFYMSGSISTVLFSFSTYRALLPKMITNSKLNIFYIYLQNIQIAFLLLCLLIISMFGYYWNIPLFSAICFICGLEFACHEKQRNFLYKGDFSRFAIILLLSYCLILTLSIFFILGEYSYFLPSFFIFILFFLVLLNVGFKSYYIAFKRVKLIARIALNEKKNWLISGLSRMYMSLDRLIFSVISFDNLWLVSILSQYFMIPVLVYDLFYLGPNKHKILKNRNKYIKEPLIKNLFSDIHLNSSFFIYSSIFFAPLLMVYFGPIFNVEISFFYAYLIIFLGFLYGMSEKIHEILIWSSMAPKIAFLYFINILFLFSLFMFIDVYDPVKSWMIVILLICFTKFFGLYFIKSLAK